MGLVLELIEAHLARYDDNAAESEAAEADGGEEAATAARLVAFEEELLRGAVRRLEQLQRDAEALAVS